MFVGERAVSVDQIRDRGHYIWPYAKKDIHMKK